MTTNVIIPSPEHMKESVKHLKEWISKEPHLPNIEDEKWLESFLYHNKFRLEKTKSKLENYFTLKNKYPEILKNRDPASPEMLQFREFIKIAFTKVPKGNSWVVSSKPEANADGLDMNYAIKKLSMFMDILLLDKDNGVATFDSITDLQDLRYLHFLKFVPVVMKLVAILRLAYTERVKSVHLINFPSFAGILLQWIRKFLPRKLSERIHVHTASKNTLFETVDKDYVCRDFGGNGPSLAELEDESQRNLEKYREWFQEQDNFCSDESLRRKNVIQIGELKGSFRNLDVD